ncbi:UNVERIFIED_CONTAM: hypothetical protein HHA_449410 [Hammondia hammondi]|eukprot:XP_008882094.1 hypothetical protein HHA_449410 [Hammondia hammondi]
MLHPPGGSVKITWKMTIRSLPRKPDIQRTKPVFSLLLHRARLIARLFTFLSRPPSAETLGRSSPSLPSPSFVFSPFPLLTQSPKTASGPKLFDTSQ